MLKIFFYALLQLDQHYIGRIVSSKYAEVSAHIVSANINIFVSIGEIFEGLSFASAWQPDTHDYFFHINRQRPGLFLMLSSPSYGLRQRFCRSRARPPYGDVRETWACRKSAPK